MNFLPLALTGAFEITLTPFSDERGWFARTWCKKEFDKTPFKGEWVQMNHSFTARAGSIRGMHFQHPPYSEVKLVRCIAGAVFDVIIDLRAGSPTFLKWVAVELSAHNKKMLLIPEGFAHGFQTLQPDTELVYCHSNYYTPGGEAGIRYNDPLLNIQWPLAVTSVSSKDEQHPLLTDNYKGIKI